jgi:hypothetical protein
MRKEWRVRGSRRASTKQDRGLIINGSDPAILRA